MIGHPREHAPQAMLYDAETQSFLQHVGRLLDHYHLETVAHAAEVGRRSADRQRRLADNENVVGRKIGIGWNLMRADSDRFQQHRGLALRIEQGDFGEHWQPLPLTSPAGTLSPTGGEGWGEGE